MEYIKIRGAREHNLKNLDIDIPKNKFVVITGVSGSGKSSLDLKLYILKVKEDMLKVFQLMLDSL